MKRKSFPVTNVTIKDATTGEFEAVFATLGVIDSDGDVIEKSAIDDGAPIVVSTFGHGIWKGEMPVGSGTIHEVNDELIAKGRFFMKSSVGHDTFVTVDELSKTGQGEWSFGLMDVDAERATKDGVTANFIKSVRVPEVSPVFMGAGVNTRTLATKGLKQLNSDVVEQLRNAGRDRWGDDDHYVYPEDYDTDETYVIFSIYGSGDAERLVQVSYTTTGDTITLGTDESEVERDVVYAPKQGQKFSDHLASVLADVTKVADRAEEVVALRAAKGKTITDNAAETLTAIAAQLDRVKTIATPPETPDDDIQAEYLRFVMNSQGVTQ